MIVVLGAGESGVGAALLAKKLGNEVFVSDRGSIKDCYKRELTEAGIAWEEDKHSEGEISNATLVIKSPGIPNTSFVQSLKESGVELVSEIEYASRYTTGKIIGVTGSNGKTTTSSLCYHILSKAGLDVGLAGNIGDSFARCLAKGDRKYWVLELSSFQLDDILHFRPKIAMVLNISPDHLDRYEGSMENYLKAKMRIAENQTDKDHFIYWEADHYINKELKNVRSKKYSFGEKPTEMGAYTEREKLIINTNGEQLTMTIHELALQGKHNCYNSMAGGIAAKLLGISNDIVRECLSDFEKIEHRLEPVLKVNGVDYINDSKATNVNATWYALESMNKSVVWVCGGVDKGNDYQELMSMVGEKVKAIVCLGQDNSKIIESFGGVVDTIVDTHNMKDAVKAAYKLASKGDAVLLSPACASFDLFASYEDRGRQFKKQIRLL